MSIKNKYLSSLQVLNHSRVFIHVTRVLIHVSSSEGLELDLATDGNLSEVIRDQF